MKRTYLLWIFLLIIISSKKLYTQWSPESFVSITTDQGLPDNTINHLFQDHIGFIWIATNGGLVKYDGHTYLTYKPQGTNPTSVGGRQIKHIIENKDGNLWLASNRGVHAFDRNTEKFRNYSNFLEPDGSVAVPLFEDAKGYLWLVVYKGAYTYQGKLIRLDPANGSWQYFSSFTNSKGQNGFDDISVFVELAFSGAAVVQDQNGLVWIGGAMENGLAIFDPEKEDFRYFKHQTNNQNSLPNNTISALYEDSDGVMWIGTHQGFCKYDPKNQDFINIPFQAPSDNPIQDAIFDIIEDQNGSFWLIKNNQLDYFNKENNKFSIIFQGNVRPQAMPVNLLAIGEGRDYELFFLMNTGSRLGFVDTRLGGNAKIKEFPPNDYKLNHINSMCTGLVSREGILWLGNTKVGILKEAPFRRNFIKYPETYGPKFANHQVSSILQDMYQRVWIGTQKGLRVVDPYSNKTWVLESFEGSNIETLFEDRNGYLWVGTRSNGLFRLDVSTVDLFSKNYVLNQQSETSSAESKDFDGKFALDGDLLTRWATDFSDPQWIEIDMGAIRNIGLIILHWEFAAAKKYRIQLSNDRKRWYTIYEETSGAGGVEEIKILNKESGRYLRILGTERTSEYGYSLFEIEVYKPLPIFEQYVHSQADTQNIGGARVSAIYEDTKGQIWIGTNNKTLGRFNPETNKWDNFVYPKGEQNHTLGAIQEDERGRIWARSECCTDSESLVTFDPETQSFATFSTSSKDSSLLSSQAIHSMYTDEDGNIWIATQSNGINLFLTDSSTFKRFIPFNSFSEETNVILQDSKSRIWAATLHEGLYQLDPTKGVLDNYSTIDGLNSDQIYSLVEDLSGNLWLSTDKGISVLNPDTREVKNLTTSNGLMSSGYPGVSYKDKNGNLYFSGEGGIDIVNVNKVFRDTLEPEVVISDFFMGEQIIRPGEEEAPIKSTIDQTTVINLSHDQNIIGFRFSALHFSNPSNNQYEVILEGLDERWKKIGNQNEVHYTGLAPGNYVFKVRASNPDGVWGKKEKSVKVNIRHPWWEQWWAYLLYASIVSGLLFLGRKTIIQQERIKSDLKLKALEAEKLQEVDRLKTHFFANISHEFRTPLTLILGPVQQMYEGSFKGDFQRQYKSIIKNGKRLLELINQLLDLSKIDAQGLKIQASKEDIVLFIRTIYASFESLANSRNIDFEFISSKESLEIYYDREKLEKIFLNLLSNAFKFTPEKGNIVIRLSVVDTNSQRAKTHQVSNRDWKTLANDHIHITIQDSGVGIPSKHLPHIFNRFYQVDESDTRIHKGTGIGLALVKELVELHHGYIYAESEKRKGTTFHLLLPIGKAHFKEDEIVFKTSNVSLRSEIIDAEYEDLPTYSDGDDTFSTPTQLPETSQPLILIVEDNIDMRRYLIENLEDSYRIITAKNGLEGYKLANDEIPELVISDVMMPKMDGRELCLKLRGNLQTSHIPVILLTAKAGEESKIEGLKTGADDYILKPFSPSELRIRVQNLIEQREALRKLFSRNLSLEPKEISITSTDETFLKDAITIVENNMEEERFGVEQFVAELDLSHQQVYRKIKALTDQTPSVFIRTIRLKRAAQLLKISGINVSEVIYKSGFTNHSYFSKCFKDQFDMSPSEYQEKYAI